MPMAIAIGFGVLFATFITLLMVLCLYLVLEDSKTFLGKNSRTLPKLQNFLGFTSTTHSVEELELTLSMVDHSEDD